MVFYDVISCVRGERLYKMYLAVFGAVGGLYNVFTCISGERLYKMYSAVCGAVDGFTMCL